MTSWLFLVAYTCSGLAGLVYEVTWTRLLTLYLGHTTAAASAVVAAFLGGLAIGAAAGGRVASAWTPRQCLQAYVGLEIAVVICALLLPFELQLFAPLLRSTYANGDGGTLFALIRILSCIFMVMLPALALGATFPMAIRWYARASSEPARESGRLYFLNTVGATIGSILAGFVLIPAIGMRATIYVAMVATTIAAGCVLIVLQGAVDAPEPLPPIKPRQTAAEKAHSYASPTLAMVILGVSGFAALVHEIAWTRILSLILGPTTYAFAATLAAVIAGVAIGSGIGTRLVATRAPKAAGMLAFALLLAAVTAGQTYSLAGTRLPMMVARYVAEHAAFDQLLWRGVLLTIALILPTSACLGAAFPLALSLADPSTRQRSEFLPRSGRSDRDDAAARFGLVYAVNTIGSVIGSLAAGFFFIPAFGIRATLWIVSGSLIAATLALIFSGALTGLSRGAGLFVAAMSVFLVVASPGWDRELLASGVYMYAPYVPRDLDLETQLKAGELLYYEEGAAATVSVKKLTGTTTLAVDGKTDASNRGDMLTQKLIAHIPLLLHEDPKDVFILGLGSGMTVGAALTHPIARLDVVELSPEVVEASDFFKVENRNALDDPRTHLIIGDGRSHLTLTDRKYDVIISEPSNPWIAGVSSLFTKEYFESARDRLKPDGIICQWVNGYNISAADLKSVLATFTSVFSRGRVLLVGSNDVLMIATLRDQPLPDHAIQERLRRPEVAEDLASVGVVDAATIRSMEVGTSPQLLKYTAGSPIFTDDRLTLEFTAPREIHRRRGDQPAIPPLSDEAVHVTAATLRHRAAMLFKADHFQPAMADYLAAIRLAPSDATILDGLVKTALILKKPGEALAVIEDADGADGAEALVARSKLLAANDQRDEAIAAAREAAAKSPLGVEQLASLYADAGDTIQLDATVNELRKVAADRASTEYYAAAAAFLHGDANSAVEHAQRAIAIDPNYAPTYDLLGAAYTRLGQLDPARAAFKKSLSFDAHDSTAYENLGVLELNAGNRVAAAKYFAEALWLVPDSQISRQGLAQSSP